MELSWENYPSIHLKIKLDHNEKIQYDDNNINDDKYKTDFFENITKKMITINGLASDKEASSHVFPKELINKNCVPFDEPKTISPSLELSDELVLKIININNDYSLSIIEELCYIYKDVYLYRLFNNNPFELTFILHCTNKVKDIYELSFKKVINKINLDNIYVMVDSLCHLIIELLLRDKNNDIESLWCVLTYQGLIKKLL